MSGDGVGVNGDTGAVATKMGEEDRKIGRGKHETTGVGGGKRYYPQKLSSDGGGGALQKTKKVGPATEIKGAATCATTSKRAMEQGSRKQTGGWGRGGWA